MARKEAGLSGGGMLRRARRLTSRNAHRSAVESNTGNIKRPICSRNRSKSFCGTDERLSFALLDEQLFGSARQSFRSARQFCGLRAHGKLMRQVATRPILCIYGTNRKTKSGSQKHDHDRKNSNVDPKSYPVCRCSTAIWFTTIATLRSPQNRSERRPITNKHCRITPFTLARVSQGKRPSGIQIGDNNETILQPSQFLTESPYLC